MIYPFLFVRVELTFYYFLLHHDQKPLISSFFVYLFNFLYPYQNFTSLPSSQFLPLPSTPHSSLLHYFSSDRVRLPMKPVMGIAYKSWHGVSSRRETRHLLVYYGWMGQSSRSNGSPIYGSESQIDPALN